MIDPSPGLVWEVNNLVAKLNLEGVSLQPFISELCESETLKPFLSYSCMAQVYESQCGARPPSVRLKESLFSPLAEARPLVVWRGLNRLFRCLHAAHASLEPLVKARLREWYEMMDGFLLQYYVDSLVLCVSALYGKDMSARDGGDEALLQLLRVLALVTSVGPCGHESMGRLQDFYREHGQEILSRLCQCSTEAFDAAHGQVYKDMVVTQLTRAQTRARATALTVDALKIAPFFATLVPDATCLACGEDMYLTDAQIACCSKGHIWRKSVGLHFILIFRMSWCHSSSRCACA